MKRPLVLVLAASLALASSAAAAEEWTKASSEGGVTIYTRDKAGSDIKEVKAIGEWDNTLLIIAADHSTWAGSDDMGIAIQPDHWQAWAWTRKRPRRWVGMRIRRPCKPSGGHA